MLRVTLTDVAKEAGVHHSTVSRALRNHPGIPATTRDRIRRIAEEIGYIPDPNLSALASYKNRKRKPGFLSNLAWITNFPMEDGWTENPHFLSYFNGAKKRAAELGFAIEIFWLAGSIQAGKSPANILRARGIRGLLICPQPSPDSNLEIDLNDFSAVSFGYTLANPRLHNVALDHFRSTQMLTRKLAQLGYRRPKLLLSKGSDARVNFSWSAGYQSATRELSLPFHEATYLDSNEPKQFIKSILKDAPDVILATRGWAIQAMRILTEAGQKVPDDIAIAAVNANALDAGLGGVIELGELVGSHGIDMISAMIQRGERGVPSHVKHMTTDGEFYLGKTLKNK